MKGKAFWIISLLMLIGIIGISTIAVAGNGAEVSNDDISAGVWRDGKAGDWDFPETDPFMWYPRGYRPEQPIKFSHKVHMEKNHMECQYCHSGVSKSPYPTIPSVETCMGCHNTVKTDSPEIEKLADYYEKGEPVPWVMVHHLPEHAVFNHERHVKAGVGCQSCHGQVQQMDVVEKVATFQMGFCVSCHREQGVSIDCATCHY